jgi:hypothetical protein
VLNGRRLLVPVLVLPVAEADALPTFSRLRSSSCNLAGAYSDVSLDALDVHRTEWDGPQLPVLPVLDRQACPVQLPHCCFDESVLRLIEVGDRHPRAQPRPDLLDPRGVFQLQGEGRA